MAWATKSNVLVVDDNAYIRRAIVLRLARAGYYLALQASNAHEAIQTLEARDDIDLICTDVEMPGLIDGHRPCCNRACTLALDQGGVDVRASDAEP